MARIRELSSEADSGHNSFALSLKLWTLYSARSLPDLAGSFADRMLEAGDLASERRLGALTAKGTTAMMCGRLDDAIDHLEQALDLTGNKPPAGEFAIHPSPSSWQCKVLPIHGYIMVALALVGKFSRSLEHLDKALAISSEPVPPKHSVAAHLGAAGVLSYVLGDMQRSRACSERGLALAQEHHLTSLVAGARWQLTCLDIKSGDQRACADRLTDAWRDYLDVRHAAPAPFAPILLADACRESGLVEQGLTIIDAAWRDTRDGGLRWYDPELRRLTGDLLLIEGGRSSRTRALRCYEDALNLAREQGSRFYELRAAISLGKLDRTGRKSHAALRRARAAVGAEIATPDLIAAAELIDR